jgi:hypothetical protein
VCCNFKHLKRVMDCFQNGMPSTRRGHNLKKTWHKTLYHIQKFECSSAYNGHKKCGKVKIFGNDSNK